VIGYGGALNSANELAIRARQPDAKGQHGPRGGQTPPDHVQKVELRLPPDSVKCYTCSKGDLATTENVPDPNSTNQLAFATAGYNA
jgi:hypothetical protein